MELNGQLIGNDLKEKLIDHQQQQDFENSNIVSASRIVESKTNIVESVGHNIKNTPWFAYPVLILCGASGAMDGPFSQFLTTRNAFLRMSWKFQGILSLFMIIQAVILIYQRQRLSTWILKLQHIKMKDYQDLVLTSIGLIGMQSFLTWGAIYTIMTHANLFSSVCAIMIVAVRLVSYQKVTRMEIIGAIIAVSGCMLTSLDPSAEKVSSEDNHITFGNFLSFCSAVFATLYIVKGQIVSAKIDPMQYFLVLNLICCFLFYTIFPIIFWREFRFNFDLDTGLFGWMTHENAAYCLFVVSFLNGVGTLGLQYLVFKYFSPVVAGTMMLLEPLFSQIYGIALDLDHYPGYLTYIGGTIILIGLFILLKFENKEL